MAGEYDFTRLEEEVIYRLGDYYDGEAPMAGFYAGFPKIFHFDDVKKTVDRLAFHGYVQWASDYLLLTDEGWKAFRTLDEG